MSVIRPIDKPMQVLAKHNVQVDRLYMGVRTESTADVINIKYPENFELTKEVGESFATLGRTIKKNFPKMKEGTIQRIIDDDFECEVAVVGKQKNIVVYRVSFHTICVDEDPC